MKKIFLLLVVAMSVATLNAQTAKKSTKKAKPMSAEAKSKAAATKLEEDRQVKFEDERIARMQYDSMRHENERIADMRFDSDRVATKQAKMMYIDSMNQVSWKSMSKQNQLYANSEHNTEMLIANANLGTNQGRQVRDILSAYNDKAMMVTMDSVMTQQERGTKLTTLNTERRAKLTAVLGKSRERKLERERKDLVKKNGSDMSEAWIDTAENEMKK